MPMLNGRLTLHNVNDVESLCQSIINRDPASGELQPHEREDLLSYLVETCWELSLDYNPAKNPNGHEHPSGGFAGWAAHLLRRRLGEWRRTHIFRTHWKRWDGTYQRVPNHEPLDQPEGTERALPGGSLDPAEYRTPDLLRALQRPARRPAWLDNSPGEAGTRRAA